MKKKKHIDEELQQANHNASNIYLQTKHLQTIVNYLESNGTSSQYQFILKQLKIMICMILGSTLCRIGLYRDSLLQYQEAQNLLNTVDATISSPTSASSSASSSFSSSNFPILASISSSLSLTSAKKNDSNNNSNNNSSNNNTNNNNNNSSNTSNNNTNNACEYFFCFS